MYYYIYAKETNKLIVKLDRFDTMLSKLFPVSQYKVVISDYAFDKL